MARFGTPPPEERPPPLTREQLQEVYRNSRLSLPGPVRILVASAVSFSTGMVLGLVQGSKMAGLRFRAEHAHKLPSSAQGWYLYHKSKNYHVALGGVKEGIRMGAKVSIWTTIMFSLENMFDNYRGTADALNTVWASVTMAGAFSLWHRFSLPMAARTTKTALVVGICYGGLQDLLSLARGRHVGYVDKIRRRVERRDIGTASSG